MTDIQKYNGARISIEFFNRDPRAFKKCIKRITKYDNRTMVQLDQDMEWHFDLKVPINTKFDWMITGFALLADIRTREFESFEHRSVNKKIMQSRITEFEVVNFKTDLDVAVLVALLPPSEIAALIAASMNWLPPF